MAAYWMTFANHSAGCVEGPTVDEARQNAVAAVGESPKTVDRLPYPANPRLYAVAVQFSDGCEEYIPSFCMHPEKCKGCGSCPRDMSCTE